MEEVIKVSTIKPRKHIPTGRPIGRPKKIPSEIKIKRSRGRPKKEVTEKPTKKKGRPLLYPELEGKTPQEKEAFYNQAYYLRHRNLILNNPKEFKPQRDHLGKRLDDVARMRIIRSDQKDSS